MSLMVAIASGSVKSTPAWMLPCKALNKFQFAFHLVLKNEKSWPTSVVWEFLRFGRMVAGKLAFGGGWTCFR